MKKAIVIDGNSIMNRAFYATQSSNMKNADGLFTGALFGFLNIILKNIEEVSPDYIAVAFDKKAPTFRHKMYEAYKGTRHAMPEELAMQMPYAKELLDSMRIDRIELEGYEADDILGTLSKSGEENGVKTYILTGDRDSYQLVTDFVNIRYCQSKGAKSETIVYDKVKIAEQYGLTPEALIDVKSLMGDSSDNVPGVRGVGEKTAVSLIQTYGSLEGVYENIDAISQKKLKENLLEDRETAFLSKKLVTIDKYVPIDSILIHEKREYDFENLSLLLKKLEFKSFLGKMCPEVPATVPSADLPQASVTVINMNDFTGNFEACKDIIQKAKELGKVAVIYKTEDNDFTGITLSFEDDSVFDFDFKTEKEEKSVPEDNRLDLFSMVSLQEESNEPESKEKYYLQFIDTFREIFESFKVKKVFFDSKPFILWLSKRNCTLKNLYCDVKIAAYLSDSLRRTDNFADAYRFYTGTDLPETKYADSVGIAHIDENIHKKIEEDNMTTLYKYIELPTVFVLADMEKEGFRVKPEVLLAEGEKFTKRLGELEEKIYVEAGCHFNINSTKQLGEILFEKLKLGKGTKTKTGYKTDIDVLEKLAEDHELPGLIIEYRQNKKLMSTYIDGLLQVVNRDTGKIYSTFNQTVTATGRLSSTEPNLQNIPVRHEIGKKIRTAFVPSGPGRILVDADYSQIELRIMAHLSGDETMKNAFINGEDIHTLTAAKVNNILPSEVTPEMRSRAKAVNFGIIYGISDFGLSRDIGVSVYSAKKYIEEYFAMYPGIKEYLDTSVEFAKKNGYASTIMGRRRYLPELKSTKYLERQFGERVAMNMPIQGTAADIIKLAMIKVNEELKKQYPTAKLILQVHDELLLDVDKKDEEQITALLKNCMENVCRLSVPLPVSVSSGENWGIK